MISKKTMECACGGTAKAFTTKFMDFDVRGWKCKKCKEEFLDPRDVGPILKLNKLVREHNLRSKVGYVGNSITLRIPKPLAAVYNFRTGKKVEYTPEKNGVLVKVLD